MLQINVHDPKVKLADLITAVENGEEILITTDNKTFKIVEVEVPQKRRKAGSAKDMIKIADDFNVPIDDFKDYMRYFSKINC